MLNGLAAHELAPADELFGPLAPHLSDIDLIHAISVELIGKLDRRELYGKIVDAAMAITRSQFGTMQLLCPLGDPSGHGGELQLMVYRGLPPEAVKFWQWVNPAAYSSCTVALKSGRRAVIADYEEWREIAGTEDLLAFRCAGIRSAQTTPLLSRGGKLLGMISTHWDQPHRPSERDLRLLDILARQAADLLERTLAEEELRLLNETLSNLVEQRSQELVASEDQVRHMQKMEAIGQFTGGVAHDFNNLLTVIRASAELLATRELSKEKQKKFIDAIADTAGRAAKLTSRLLVFARRQTLRPDIFEAADKVEALADMLRTIVGSKIALAVGWCSTASYIEVDASQFETALVNLTVNGRDAMNGEGHIEITIERSPVVPARRGHAETIGDFVKVSVADIGCGMTPDQIEHIFEPFYTTKEVGKGTGLGLSQVYSFVKDSGGEIDVASVIGKGTTFSLYLPRAEMPEVSGELETSSIAPAVDAPDLDGEEGELASVLASRFGGKRYDVFGSKPGEIFRFDFNNAQAAVKKANSMINDGFEEIYILSPNGKVLRPPDFDNLFLYRT